MLPGYRDKLCRAHTKDPSLRFGMTFQGGIKRRGTPQYIDIGVPRRP